jgi:hypothetical protein
MNTLPIIILVAGGIAAIVIITVVGLLMVQLFIRRIQSGHGPMGSVLQQSRETARETLEMAKERLQVERELLATQKETNELLKQMVSRQKLDV